MSPTTNLSLKFFPQKCLFHCKLQVYKFGKFLSIYKRKLVFFPNFSLISFLPTLEQVFPCQQIFNANSISIKTRPEVYSSDSVSVGTIESSETLWESFGTIWELFGTIWESFGTIWESFGIIWESFGTI